MAFNMAPSNFDFTSFYGFGLLKARHTSVECRPKVRGWAEICLRILHQRYMSWYDKYFSVR